MAEVFDFSKFEQLQTNRLLLRRLDVSDDKLIFELRSNVFINKFLDREPMKDEKEAIAFIDKINKGIEEGEWMYWSLLTLDGIQKMGTICLWSFSQDRKNAEVGFELLPRYQGLGFMSEALGLVLDIGFNSMLLDIIKGYTHKNNLASKKLLEKLSFVNQGKADDDNHYIFSKQK